jgi:membrane fusion protein (multidrug efflux system)
LALMMASCGKKQEAAVVEEKAVPVTVASASRSNISISRTYTGTLEGWKQAKIYASIPEAVIELPVREGSFVQAGQAVIILDKEGRASQLRQAQAIYDEAKDNFAKMSRLFEQGAISEQSLTSIKTNLDVAKANYESARQAVELTSPISGILTDLTVNIGQYAPLGMPLATIAQTDKMRMTIYVDSRSASFLRAGQMAIISLAAAGAGQSNFEGEIIEIARSADPETRLFRVELQIDNKDRNLNPGTFARAEIIVQELDSVLTVPREVVFFIEGIPKVYVITDSSKAEERSIEIGENTLERYQVLSGLAEGDRVIVLGRGQVENGSSVIVVEQVSPSSSQGNSREN